MYLGDFTTANTVYVFFNTFDSNDPSASVTLTGLTTSDILIYKNGSTTERSSTAGYTLLDTDGIDFDGKTGIHGFSIDLSNNTDSGFFAAGGEYTVVVASVTVDAATVNFVAAHFSIERTGGALALLKGTNSLADIESKIDTLTTNVATVDTVVDGIVTTLGTPAGASVSADIAAIEAQTDDIGAAGAGLTAVPWNASWDAEVQSEVADALAAFWTSPATLVDLIWDEAISGHSTAGTTGKYLTDVYTYLGGIVVGGVAIIASSINALADQVWDEATSGHTTAGTFGKLAADVLVDTAEIGAAGAGLTALASAANLATVDTVVDAILVDTDTTIPATLSTIAGYIDTEVAAIKAKTDNIPASPAAVSDIPTATQNADALLNRDMSAVSDTNARTPLNALRFLRNKYSISGTTLTVTKEDDSTSAWTSVLTTNAAADPVTGSDPA